MQGVATVAAVSLEIGYPTMASAPHSIVNGMKNLLAIAAVTDITFKVRHSAEFVDPKLFLSDPTSTVNLGFYLPLSNPHRFHPRSMDPATDLLLFSSSSFYRSIW